MRHVWQSLALACGLIAPLAWPAPATPRIEGEWWTLARSPELGSLTGRRQQPVDFSAWEAADGTWQLWSCIRATREAGNTRLFYCWAGASPLQPGWRPVGIALRADPTLGETPGGLQAPFVFRDGARFVMVYGDWANIRAQASSDGKTFARLPGPLFGGDPASNTRDPMVLRDGDRWICYYSANPDGRGRVFARTSVDLAQWSAEREVAGPGVGARDPRFAAECPFVVERSRGEYYLFYTQVYGTQAHTTVRFTHDPLDFNRSDNLAAELPVAAPEIFRFHGAWIIAALRPDLAGIQAAHLVWETAASR